MNPKYKTIDNTAWLKNKKLYRIEFRAVKTAQEAVRKELLKERAKWFDPSKNLSI